MNVGELLEVLAGLPNETPVLVENGQEVLTWFDATEATVQTVVKHANWYAGVTPADAESGRSAVVIG